MSKPMEYHHYLALKTHREYFYENRWFRISLWRNYTRLGEPVKFVSIWIGKLQFYHGKAKVDGSQTYDWGTFDEYGNPLLCVYTDKPSEQWALRYRTKGRGESHWNNQGGS